MSLPPPDSAFRWSVEPWGYALRCRPLEVIAQHLFTTRQLALRSASALAWTRAAASLGAGLDQVMRVKQVHGNAVCLLRRGESGPSATDDVPRADALVTDDQRLVLAVQVADCVPVLMADSRTGAVAAVHAGWRGTAAGVVRAAIDVMTRELQSDPRDLTVALGPSIGACCYEVGTELMASFRSAGWSERDIARWFTHQDRGSLRLDLAAANIDQIRAAGVPCDQIHAVNLCTQTHADIFDSFRAAGANAGRMAGLIRGGAAPVRAGSLDL